METTVFERASVTEPLTIEAMLHAAENIAGYNDWGLDQSFKIGLNKLISAVEDNNPTPTLRADAYNWIIQILTTKLRILHDENQHPEILNGKIENPLIVIGLPRAGTTILFDILSLDPKARSPREWEISAPWPATETASFDTDPRIHSLQESFDEIVKISPEMNNIYPMDATMPGECNSIMVHHFASPNFAALLAAPSFDEWFIHTRVAGQYASHKRILQQMQWKGPKGNWLLKSPAHLFNLEGLMTTYPDAQLVWTHRDPSLTMSSISSHIHAMHKANGINSNKVELGHAQWRNWKKGLQLGTQARVENVAVENAIFDISNQEIIRDPVATIRRIYDHFDRDFNSEFALRIEDFIDNHNAASRRGKHKHSLQEYGLDANVIRTELADYYDRFGYLC